MLGDFVYAIYEKAADRHRCLVNLGLTSGRGLAQQLPRQVGARHAPRHDAPFEARYGQSCLFEFTSIATCRTLEWWAESRPSSSRSMCKSPNSASFLFAFQSSLGQEAPHETGLRTPPLAVHAEARPQKSGTRSGSAKHAPWKTRLSGRRLS